MSVGSVSIRTRMANGLTYVNLRISHPMENGNRTDSMGTPIPSWYLTDLDVLYNDSVVSTMQLGPLVSRNPAVSLELNGGEKDAILKVVWVDNRGEGGERSTKLR